MQPNNRIRDICGEGGSTDREVDVCAGPTDGSHDEVESRRAAAAANEEESSSPWSTPGAKNQGGVMEVLTHRMRVLAAAEDEHDRREERLDEHLDVQVSVEYAFTFPRSKKKKKKGLRRIASQRTCG